MLVVISTGGKQYKVSSGDIIKVERVSGRVGDIIYINDVLLSSSNSSIIFENSFLSKIRVKTRILKHFRGEKLVIFKKRRRHNSKKKNGHRQNLTLLRILLIEY